MGGAHQRAVGRPARRVGRTSWRRFGLVFVPAMLVLVLIGLGATGGAVPVALAVEGRQAVKISVKSLATQGAGTFPEFFQTAGGERKPTVVVILKDTKAQGLCASTKVDTPAGPYVLRFTTPADSEPVSIGTLRFALESIDGFGAVGQDVELNRAFTAAGVPTDAGDPGFLPIKAGRLLLNLNVSVRWATVNEVHVSGLRMAVGGDQKECF